MTFAPKHMALQFAKWLLYFLSYGRQGLWAMALSYMCGKFFRSSLPAEDCTPGPSVLITETESILSILNS